jgi:AraC-like DNA-binding protein
MPADPLTTVLGDLRLSKGCYSRSEFFAPWGFSVAARPVAHYHFVIQGQAVFRCGAELIRIEPGDLVLIPRGDAHSLSDSDGRRLVPFETLKLVEAGPDAFKLRHGRSGGKRSTMICGTGIFEGRSTHPILDLLPAALVIRRDRRDPDSGIQAAIEMMGREASVLRPGAHAVMNHLAAVIVIQAIRGWLQEGEGAGHGWVRALRDPHLGKAILSVHRKPERRWTVSNLAAEVHLSRSVFYEKFTAAVGIPPGEYVTRHAMHVAASLLRETGITIGEAAENCGYGSEAAFSRAFKRHYGVSPGAFRAHEADRQLGSPQRMPARAVRLDKKPVGRRLLLSQ